MRSAARIMLTAIVLIVAGVSSAPAQDDEVPQQTLGDGAWSWFGDPRAVHHGNRTYVGWVSQEGDIKVTSYDHDARVRTTAVLHEELEVDDHDNPSIYIRPDGRLMMFYSAHAGPDMFYRLSTRPYDVTSWEPRQKLPTNTPGTRGYTYPNPMWIPAEGKTYLFWRGGNFQPNFSTMPAGEDTWSEAQTLISVPGSRPYVKYASNGEDTIHFAFTETNPNETTNNNLYYAYYRGGSIYRADGTRIGALGDPISPGQADLIFDQPENAWVHDIALDAEQRPVIVFARLFSPLDHRYAYARWTGSAWEVHDITPAGGSISDSREPNYSAGISLDHEDPSVVYLARDVNGTYEVETWRTPDGGASWSSQPVTEASTEDNLRPVSPRGLLPFGADFGVVWLRGQYNHYLTYKTSVATQLATGGNQAPIADADHQPRTGPAPLPVEFDGTPSRDLDGQVVSWEWDFGDGEQAEGAKVSHTFEAEGRYFPRLTVTDDAGATDVLVQEVVVGPPAPPTVFTGSANPIRKRSATLNGLVNAHNQPTRYHFEYGPTTAYGLETRPRRLLPVDASQHAVSARVRNLTPGAVYHYRLVATNPTGTTEGEDRTFTVTPSPPGSAYRRAVLGTAGLRAYWRLGEDSGATARDETGAHAGQYLGGFDLGQPGALFGDPDTAAGFDGATGEMTAPGPALAASGSLEGWFDWRGGTALMRDNTTGGGWILAFDSAGSFAYRLGGTTFTTELRTGTIRGGWHHVVATKDGGDVALYLDGRLVHRASGAGNVPATLPWHVMRNGLNSGFTTGVADEVAAYDIALTEATVKEHYALGFGP